jgi:hypothetical protein
MRIRLRGNGTATVTLAAVGAVTLLSLPPSAAQPASRKAVGEDSAPAQTIPPPSSEAPGETRKLGSVLGIEVRTNREQNVGRIVDLLASRSGQVEAAVVEFGGFLGMGSRKIAIEWSALRLETQAKHTVAILDMTRDQLRAAPEYKPERPIVVRRAVPSEPPAEAAAPTGLTPAPPFEPPEPSAGPTPAAKAAAAKRKRRHRARDQD